MAKRKQPKETKDPKATGGSGGLSVSDGRADTKLAEQALTQRWPIKPEDKAILIDRMVKIVKNPRASKREQTAAFRAIVAAEGQNQADAPPVQEHKHEIQVRTEEDWYGHSIPAERNGASTADSATPGPVQGNGVRAAMGQNGNGHAGST